MGRERPHAGRNQDQRVPPASSSRAGQKQAVVCLRCKQEGHIARLCSKSNLTVLPSKGQTCKGRTKPPSVPDDTQNKSSSGEPRPSQHPQTPAPGKVSCHRCGKEGVTAWHKECPGRRPNPTHTPASSSQRAPSLPPASSPNRGDTFPFSTLDPGEAALLWDNPFSPSYARDDWDASDPISPWVKQRDAPITKDNSPSAAPAHHILTHQGEAQDLIDRQASKIQELEEMLQKKQQQIENLTRRLQECQCTRVSAGPGAW